MNKRKMSRRMLSLGIIILVFFCLTLPVSADSGVYRMRYEASGVGVTVFVPPPKLNIAISEESGEAVLAVRPQGWKYRSSLTDSLSEWECGRILKEQKCAEEPIGRIVLDYAACGGIDYAKITVPASLTEALAERAIPLTFRFPFASVTVDAWAMRDNPGKSIVEVKRTDRGISAEAEQGGVSVLDVILETEQPLHPNTNLLLRTYLPAHEELDAIVGDGSAASGTREGEEKYTDLGEITVGHFIDDKQSYEDTRPRGNRPLKPGTVADASAAAAADIRLENPPGGMYTVKLGIHESAAEILPLSWMFGIGDKTPDTAARYSARMKELASADEYAETDNLADLYAREEKEKNCEFFDSFGYIDGRKYLTLQTDQLSPTAVYVLTPHLTASFAEEIAYGGKAIEHTVTQSPHTMRIAIQSARGITDVRLMAADLTEHGMTLTHELYALDVLHADTALILGLVFPGDLSTYGVTYTDAEGVRTSCLLYLSGKDGSPVLQRIAG